MVNQFQLLIFKILGSKQAMRQDQAAGIKLSLKIWNLLKTQIDLLKERQDSHFLMIRLYINNDKKSRNDGNWSKKVIVFMVYREENEQY